MLLQFSIIPMGKGESAGDIVASIIKLIDASGLPYKTSAMSTTIEGGWDDCMALVKECHEEALKSASRIVSNISIDIRPGKPHDRLDGKIKSIEKRIGKKIKS